MIKDIKRMKNERGFTLIELLVVIVILGILAAVVVFAVGGISDKGNKSACKIDTRTLRTAEEANFAKFDSYDTEPNLVTNGFLSEVSNLHNITLTPAAAPYTAFTIKIAGGANEEGVSKKCGTADGQTVDPTNGIY